MRKLWLGILLLVTIWHVPAPLMAASFNCAKASTEVEKFICGDQTLSELDDRLATAYRESQKTNTDGSVRSRQQEWLKTERNSCHNIECIASAYKKRIAELGQTVPGVAGAATGTPVTGTYSLERGDLKVVQRGDEIVFNIEAYNSAGNTGEASGRMRLQGDTATYKNDGEDCTMVFKFSRDNATVTQRGMCGFGVSLSAAGNYKKTNSATPKIEEPNAQTQLTPKPAASPQTASANPPMASARVPMPESKAAQAIAVEALFEDYRRNEVAADDKYKGKSFLVTGYLDSIRKDFSGDMILQFRTSARSSYVSAKVDDSQKSKVAALVPGTTVILQCIGAGMTLRSPRLRNCMFNN